MVDTRFTFPLLIPLEAHEERALVDERNFSKRWAALVHRNRTTEPINFLYYKEQKEYIIALPEQNVASSVFCLEQNQSLMDCKFS